MPLPSAGHWPAEREHGSMSDARDEAPEMHACLAAEGTFDPDELSTLLGVKPDAGGRIGEGLRNGKVRERDSWHYRTKRDSTGTGRDTWSRCWRSCAPTLMRSATSATLTKHPEIHLVAHMTGATPVAR